MSLLALEITLEGLGQLLFWLLGGAGFIWTALDRWHKYRQKSSQFANEKSDRQVQKEREEFAFWQKEYGRLMAMYTSTTRELSVATNELSDTRRQLAESEENTRILAESMECLSKQIQELQNK